MKYIKFDVLKVKHIRPSPQNKIRIQRVKIHKKGKAVYHRIHFGLYGFTKKRICTTNDLEKILNFEN